MAVHQGPHGLRETGVLTQELGRRGKLAEAEYVASKAAEAARTPLERYGTIGNFYPNANLSRSPKLEFPNSTGHAAEPGTGTLSHGW